MLDPRRVTVVAEARSWLGTAYHHMGRVKGAGADCLTLLAEVYEKAGVIRHIEVLFYPPDWNLHRDVERYLEGVTRYAREVPYCADNTQPHGRAKLDRPTPADHALHRVPLPGDIAVFKFGQCFAHGAIVITWPLLIHAWHNAGVVYADATQAQLARRPVRIFDPFVAIR